MNNSHPNLLTLLDWSHRLAEGSACADCQAWIAQSPDAERKWQQVATAQELLAIGMGPKDAVELGATDVAEYLDEMQSPAAARQVELACWRSPAQLSELASLARFCRQPTELVEPSPGLTERLLTIGARAAARAARRANGRTYRLLPAHPPEPPATQSEPVAVRPRRRPMRRDTEWLRHWPLAAAAAALVVIAVGGAIGWLVGDPQRPDLGHPRVADDSVDDRPEQSPPERPLINRIVTPAPQPRPHQPEQPETSPKDPPPAAAPDRVATNSRPATTQPAPQVPIHTVPAQAAASPPDVTIQSSIGVLLIDPGQHGRLKVAAGQYSLAEPLRLVSLAESWSSVAIPDVGTVVCDGAADATIAQFGDGVLEVQLAHGKLGIDRLPAGRQVRFQTGGTQWLARGVGNYSTLAVVHDPATPSLFVPMGAVALNQGAVDQVQVGSQQVVQFNAGVVQSPQPIAANLIQAGGVFGGGWLTPPDEARRQKWRAQHGKLIEKLAAAEDAGAELPGLLDSTKDPRQAALLARWNVTVADEATGVRQTWAMLTDRRELVRSAAVRYLVELPAGDSRLKNSVRLARIELGDALGDRVAQWLQAARQPGQITAPQAVELTEFLTHRELALRQLAVSLLELHAGPALARAHRQPPAYDASGPSAKRSAAQREWRQLIRPLFAPARNAAAALAPNLGARPAGAAPQQAGAAP